MHFGSSGKTVGCRPEKVSRFLSWLGVCWIVTFANSDSNTLTSSERA
jgi:hypothetical protein